MGKMASESHNRKRHHHPVDSLCRKLQAINMMDQASNPALQIPKFQSKNFDSPQCNVRKNLEEILKKRTLKTSDSDNTMGNDTYLLSPFTDDNSSSPCPPVVTPTHRRVSDIRLETFSNSKNKEKASKSWLLMGQMGSCSPCLFRQGGSGSAQLCGTNSTEQKSTSSQEYSYLTSSPDLSTQEPKSAHSVFQSPLSQRHFLGKGKALIENMMVMMMHRDLKSTCSNSSKYARRTIDLSLSFLLAGWKLSTETRSDEESDVSLICEEDLLTTMFSACDVERRGCFFKVPFVCELSLHFLGKVAVSKLVDFLRYTTSRGSEDSSLEELCNMLDPEQKDISMDLETYHAIMKEWIEDCRRNW
ncbi:hypothetical protein JD844_028840 [Phrynosoma platyrhinos]|uniref:Protein KASH5 EF-hand-like domain-containing protein n=1 Tax=Phrynosoma platyrhinos TaxID=52577 RepID=A0ABQ7SIE8_PHRPL|nr:hypothetical protein JD844_028840 [Phrynosoma platyrhinos]